MEMLTYEGIILSRIKARCVVSPTGCLIPTGRGAMAYRGKAIPFHRIVADIEARKQGQKDGISRYSRVTQTCGNAACANGAHLIVALSAQDAAPTQAAPRMHKGRRMATTPEEAMDSYVRYDGKLHTDEVNMIPAWFWENKRPLAVPALTPESKAVLDEEDRRNEAWIKDQL